MGCLEGKLSSVTHEGDFRVKVTSREPLGDSCDFQHKQGVSGAKPVVEAYRSFPLPKSILEAEPKPTRDAIPYQSFQDRLSAFAHTNLRKTSFGGGGLVRARFRFKNLAKIHFFYLFGRWIHLSHTVCRLSVLLWAFPSAGFQLRICFISSIVIFFILFAHHTFQVVTLDAWSSF